VYEKSLGVAAARTCPLLEDARLERPRYNLKCERRLRLTNLSQCPAAHNTGIKPTREAGSA
jgi:hypothetical protein